MERGIVWQQMCIEITQIIYIYIVVKGDRQKSMLKNIVLMSMGYLDVILQMKGAVVYIDGIQMLERSDRRSH